MKIIDFVTLSASEGSRFFPFTEPVLSARFFAFGSQLQKAKGSE